MNIFLRYAATTKVLPAVVTLLALCAGPVPEIYAQAAQAASSQSPAVQGAPLTAEQQRAQHLHADAAHLDELAKQLQLELHKAGKDKLSLETVRLAQQIQWLSRQIQAELQQP